MVQHDTVAHPRRWHNRSSDRPPSPRRSQSNSGHAQSNHRRRARPSRRDRGLLIRRKLFKHSVVASAPRSNPSPVSTRYLLHGSHRYPPDVGLTTATLEEAHIKRALSASAARRPVLGSSEKLNAASPLLHRCRSQRLRHDRRIGDQVKGADTFSRLGITVTKAPA